MNQQYQQQQFLAIKRQCDLQSQIRKLIYADNKAECEFFYSSDISNMNYLTVVTINPKHREMFTLHQTAGYPNVVECLDEVLAFLNSLKQPNERIIAYGVTWYKRSVNETHTSTFYVKNLRELTDKFFENKTADDYVIQSITMLPLS